VVEGVIVQPVEASRTYALRQQVLRPNLSVAEMGLFGDDGTDTGIYGAIDAASGELVGTANVRREEAPPALAQWLAATQAVVAPGAAPARATTPQPAPATQATPRSLPDDAAHWRLRGMATREDLRGTGIGAAVLEACVGHVGAQGGGFLWCNARVAARRFYGRAGFSEWGDEFESQGTAHIVMWRTVEAEESGK
jgi:GNAT superfamily N-acetyltransferase